MHPLTIVIVRLTANTAMFLGLLVAALATWDYYRGPGAGEGGTLFGIAIGVGVFWVGFRSFRRLANELEAGRQSRTLSNNNHRNTHARQ